MTSETLESNKRIYMECLQKQLDEIDLLSSIFCNPGEIQIYDPNVISEFHEYIKGQINDIRSEMDLSIYFEYNNEKINIRIQLPHLYPLMENARVILLTPLLSKNQERFANREIENFISELDKTEGYIYQVVVWIQEEFENYITISSSSGENDSMSAASDPTKFKLDNRVDLERLFIYSHHIKSKIKRREILHQAEQLNLTGFCKPGKPGIICVEGIKEDTQKFWQIIRSMQWQRITLKIIEDKRKTVDQIAEWRRFSDFKEILMGEVDSESDAEKMNMGEFMKFLEKHKCGYIKQELFGFEG